MVLPEGMVAMKRISLIKKGAAIAATALTALALTACGNTSTQDAGSTGSSDATYKIGVLQLTEHTALDAANKGFVKALDDSGINYTIDQQNAQNDQSACQTIASKLVGDGDDLIFAIATPAAQAAANATKDIPIVGTAITDFAASDLVADNDAPAATSPAAPISPRLPSRSRCCTRCCPTPRRWVCSTLRTSPTP